MSRVLVVDDEPQILRALGINLRARGYEVDLAPDGERALDVAARHHPDVVVLDLGLPGIDGVDVIRGLRGWSQVPIVVLSVRDAEGDKVAALDAGADDYVTKPFGMNELLARLRAATRRATPGADEPVVDAVDFTVDLAAKRVTLRSGAQVRLTPTEWQLLEMLARHRGRHSRSGRAVDRRRGPGDPPGQAGSRVPALPAPGRPAERHRGRPRPRGVARLRGGHGRRARHRRHAGAWHHRPDQPPGRGMRRP